MKRHYVRWTKDERELVVQEAALLRLLDPRPSLLDILRQAQSRLPPCRRRPLRSVNAIADAAARVQAAMEQLQRPEPRPLPNIEQVFAQLNNLSARLEAALAAAKVPKPTQENGSTKRLLVIGCLPEQEAILESKCRGLPVELSFAAASERPRVPPSTDHAVLWARFTGHHWQDYVINTLGRERVAVHHGGLNSAAEKIRGLVRS